MIHLGQQSQAQRILWSFFLVPVQRSDQRHAMHSYRLFNFEQFWAEISNDINLDERPDASAHTTGSDFAGGLAMDRYLFKAQYRGATLTDDIGEEFATLSQAEAHAAVVADEFQF
jgi:hypothetical protein